MTYIIAEVGGNHDGDLDTAKFLIQSASEAGCDAVKFQTYSAEKLVHPTARALPQAKGYTRQFERFKDLEFSDSQWQEIMDECRKHRIDFLTTCFDIESLERFSPHMKAIKIASGDLTFDRLLRAASTTGKPVLISTGMSRIDEIIAATRHFDPNLLTVLHCVSAYPCPDPHANLGVIKELQGHFSSVGYSDHTIGITAPIVAAGLGAAVIEKHFTYDDSLEYGDHCLSLMEYQMADMVNHIRRIEVMMGTDKPDAIEMENREKMRRGVYASRHIKMGQVISEDDIICIRPATRRAPSDIIGKRARKDFDQLEAING